MRRTLPLVAIIMAACIPANCVVAQCTPTGNGSPITGPDYDFIRADSSFSNIDPNAVCQGTQMWSGCASTPGTPQLTYPTCTPVTNAPLKSYTVYYQSGYDPNNSQACGETSGNTITVYEKALVTVNGSLLDKQCSDFGWQNILAHEIGHTLGLADIPGNCNTGDIMSQLNADWGLSNMVSVDDCQVAETQSPSIDKDYPVDYSCSQPCYGNCYGGSCPAVNEGSPIVINLAAGEPSLSGSSEGVEFDLYNNGGKVYTAWTARDSQTGFLSLDLNGNGVVDNAGELFGNHTVMIDVGLFAANGYEALAQYDRPEHGGNGDGRIDASDAVFSRLSIWLDRNHNGTTDPGELLTMAESGVVSISLPYHLVEKKDRFGNLFRYQGSATLSTPGGVRSAPTYDVLFAKESLP